MSILDNVDKHLKTLETANDRVSFDKASAVTAENLAKLHKLMKSKGYAKKSYRQSAMEIHTYIKDGNPQIDYEGWHGTGKGNRNYGDLKTILSFYIGRKNAVKLRLPEGDDETRSGISQDYFDHIKQTWDAAFKALSKL